MEVIKAIISLVVTVMFFFLLIQLAWPILLIFGVLILFVILRLRFSARQFRRTVEREEKAFTQQRDSYSNQSRSQGQSRNTNPDIIDVEYTEEEID